MLTFVSDSGQKWMRQGRTISQLTSNSGDKAKKLIPKNQEFRSQVTHTSRIDILQTLWIYRAYLKAVSIAVQIFIAHAEVGRATYSRTEKRNAQTGIFI